MNLLGRLMIGVCALIGLGGCCYFRDSCGADGDTGVWGRQVSAPVQVWLDNHPAEWGGTGYRIPAAVSQSPLFRYVINTSEDLGPVRTVTINVFHEIDRGWSDTPAYVVTANGSGATDGILRAKKTYRLGAAGEGLHIVDGRGRSADRMALDSDAKYLMNIVVTGDRSESLRIEFRTQ